MSRTVRITFVVLAVLFVVFVWPTRYEYLHDWNTPARIDRVTGKIQWAGPNGWTDTNPLFDMEDDNGSPGDNGVSQNQQGEPQSDDESTCPATAPFPRSQSKL